MHENYENYENYERGMGASRYTPWVCLPQSGMARAKSCCWGMQGNLIATVVCCLRGRDACIRLIRLIRLIFNDEGAPLYTPRVCCAAVWYGSGQNVPFG